MKRKTRFLLLISAIAMTGVVILQFVWLNDYLVVNKERFTVSVNKLIDSALTEEYLFRMDSMEHTMENYLLDTGRIIIKSRWLPVPKRWYFEIADKATPERVTGFSNEAANTPVTIKLDSTYRQIAKLYASFYRTQYLQYGSIFYRPLSLGMFVDSMNQGYRFDSLAFRRILKRELELVDVRNDFHLLINKDATLSRYNGWFGQFISKQVKINTNSNKKLTVQAAFPMPYSFLLRKMSYLLLGSVFMIVILFFCFYNILGGLFTEKKLSLIKNDFISNISHEFKTPIATIGAALESLDDMGAYDNPARRVKYFGTARQELQRLAEMVNKILNISIYEKKDIEINKTQFKLAPMIREIMQNYDMIHTRHISWNLSGNETATLRADKELVHIAISNVIDNAIKYSLDPVNISIDLNAGKEDVAISITDKGIGMQQADTEFIFDKFHRVNSPLRAKVKGYGLGLSYTRSILNSHRGRAVIQSEPGKGTSFTLIFPRS